MQDEGKIRQLAQLVVQKHGSDALAVVNERIRGRLEAQDYHLAALWALVAEAVHRMMPDAKPRRGVQREVQEIAAGVIVTLAAQRVRARPNRR